LTQAPEVLTIAAVRPIALGVGEFCGGELMHLVDPHLPRAVTVTLAAALATIVIVLAVAARLSDVQLGLGQVASPARQTLAHAAPALSAPVRARAALRATAWLSDPFAPLVPEQVPLLRAPGRGGS
jgi:hypothetical protein